MVISIEGSAETVKIYTGQNFDNLIKIIEGDYEGNNMMRVKMISKKLTADGDDFHLSSFTTFKSSQGYTGDFGN